MHLPHSRPWLVELADLPLCPPSIRSSVQSTLTYLWTHRIPPFQSKAPYENASDVLENVIKDIQDEDEDENDHDHDYDYQEGDRNAVVVDGEGRGNRYGRTLRVIDCCSGAGGPVGVIEKRINAHRLSSSRRPVQFLMSDLHPHLSPWRNLASKSPTSSLSYISDPVDATQVGISIRADEKVSARGREGAMTDDGQRHLRTFFLSFHHFNDQLARGVLVDAMRDAEGICIFELQEPTLGSIITILMLFPLSLLLTPFQRPSLTTLFFTYIIPLIPLILVIDGLISAYRTRSPTHILHLANLASLSLHLEGGDKEEVDWKWEFGTRRHTWPWGRMVWAVGRRDRRAHDDVEGLTEVGTDVDMDEGEM